MKASNVIAGAMFLFVVQAHADGDCPRRPLSAPEKKWVADAAAAVKAALPPAPAGWVAINPADIGYTYTNTQLASTPADACAEGGPYALEVEAAAFYTPRDSALAQRADIGRRGAALNRRQGSLNRSIGASSEVTGAGISGNAGDLMQYQQEMMAAQASGDMARMQRAAEKMQKASEAISAASQQASEQGSSDYAQSSKMQQEGKDLSAKYESLAQAAAKSPLVIATASINPQPLRWRPGGSRPISASGAAQSWFTPEMQTCFGDDCNDHGASAVALFGNLVKDSDSSDATSWVLPGAVKAPAAQRSASLIVEGTATEVERVFRSANFAALAR